MGKTSTQTAAAALAAGVPAMTADEAAALAQLAAPLFAAFALAGEMAAQHDGTAYTRPYDARQTWPDVVEKCYGLGDAMAAELAKRLQRASGQDAHQDHVGRMQRQLQRMGMGERDIIYDVSIYRLAANLWRVGANEAEELGAAAERLAGIGDARRKLDALTGGM